MGHAHSPRAKSNEATKVRRCLLLAASDDV